ncbi:sialate O-acetylesterase [Carboxylicivirga sp. RSCT41]|uniref:sialate O-acetylesterase n=1 Tax=Carboxylicivirga agarovorans TaxID=3417570 RepID=UPI003D347B75
MLKLILGTFFVGVCILVQVKAEITMPVAFGNGMVLQRDMPVRIFGQASDGAYITVRFNGQEKTVTAQNREWMLSLDAMSAGGPYELTISGDGTAITYTDVMVGEVWVAGGQSNMNFELAWSTNFEADLPSTENPNLRFMKIPVTEFGEIDRVGLVWKNFDPQSVREFSAVSYYFATELQKRLGVTVGIIGSYRGATWNENWMTRESIESEPALQYLLDDYETEYAKFEDEAAYEAAYQQFLIDLQEWEDNGGWSSGARPMAPMGPKAYQRPSGLYECMIKPLQPYTIKGCIWYQGEGNAGRYDEFMTLFPAFIKGWRDTWQLPDLPFYFVQLPGYGEGQTWPQFRQAQFECWKRLDHCGMVVAEGAGDEADIHPKVKKPIGERLAIAVSAGVYGQNHIPYGPAYKSVEFQNGKATIFFDYSGSGLVLNKENSSSFEIAGEDKVFKEAQTTINGSELILWNDAIGDPKYVRYAYSPFPEMVLFNQEGLPASPFTILVGSSHVNSAGEL